MEKMTAADVYANWHHSTYAAYQSQVISEINKFAANVHWQTPEQYRLRFVERFPIPAAEPIYVTPETMIEFQSVLTPGGSGFKRPAGRPPLYGAPMEAHTMMFTADQWQQIQSRGGAAYIRRLIDQDNTEAS